MINNVVSVVSTWGAGIIAAILIATVVKEGLQYIKGSGSVSLWGILGKVLILIFMLGIILLASNWKTNFKPLGEGLGKNTLDITGNLINEVTSNTTPKE